MRPAHIVVLFDGRCGLCRTSRKWAARLDWLDKAIWTDFRDPKVRAAVPQLSDEQLEKEMWVFTDKGEILAGFFGWRRLLRSFPLTFLPSLLMYLPPVVAIGKRVYAHIAANRPITCQLGQATPMDRDDWEPILRQALPGNTHCSVNG